MKQCDMMVSGTTNEQQHGALRLRKPHRSLLLSLALTLLVTTTAELASAASAGVSAVPSTAGAADSEAAYRARREAVIASNAKQIELDFTPQHPSGGGRHHKGAGSGGGRRIMGFDQKGNHFRSMAELIASDFSDPNAQTNAATNRQNPSATAASQYTLGADGNKGAQGGGGANDGGSGGGGIYGSSGFYGSVLSHWETQEASVHGVTRVSDVYSEADMAESRAFIEALEGKENSFSSDGAAVKAKTKKTSHQSRGMGRRHPAFGNITIGRDRALDVGTGIGRVAVGVLAPSASPRLTLWSRWATCWA